MPNNRDKNGFIRLLGVQQNNLKGIDVEIPINQLTVLTGVSGSGKSSLAFDTLYAEGQRRYVESLSAYARQFLERINKPRIGEIEGISPAIAIRQKSASRNPRSTVGTGTEIHDYLRLLYARIGTTKCRECDREVRRNTIDEIVDCLLSLPQGTRIYITFPFKNSRLDLNSNSEDKADEISVNPLLDNLLRHGYRRFVSTGKSKPPSIYELPEHQFCSLTELNKSIILADRLVIGPNMRERLVDSLELCYRDGNGVTLIYPMGKKDLEKTSEPLLFTNRFECPYCEIPYRSPEPRLFSFNNPYGACPTCHGFGNTTILDPTLIIPDPSKTIDNYPIEPFTKPRFRRFHKKLKDYAQQEKIPLDIPFEKLPEKVRQTIWDGKGKFPGIKGFFRYLEKRKYKMHIRVFISRYRGYTLCPDCRGERLCIEARNVYVGGQRLGQLATLPICEIQLFFSQLDLNPGQVEVAEKIFSEILQRLKFLIEVGLGYLTLDRLTSNLSSGEMQRIHLAASLSSSLTGTLYVLDEPSIGLHARDTARLVNILRQLRDLGNTIVVVEHEKEVIEAADHIIDIGPGAGEQGGEIVHSGDLLSLRTNTKSLTGRYLAGKQKIPTPTFRRSSNGSLLTIRGAHQHNLKNLTVEIPLRVLVCVTGVSGSGKSTLVQDCLYAGIKQIRGEWNHKVGAFDSIDGSDQFTDILLVDQSPIGRTPRSNPITYIKAFDDVRKTFSSQRKALSLNLSKGHFSFNIPGGRCQTCHGAGTITIEMQFLADVELQCEDCKGTRYSSKVLEVTYKGKNITEVLSLSVLEAIEFFKAVPQLVRKLKVLDEVGLGYLRLGQSATTLSGGEAQRIKLASYLSKSTSKRPLFIFDEPTTGLHFDDISKLLRAFDCLISRGATVLVIEHNLDVIKCADWIIDLGPEGGVSGGNIVIQGPPEVIAATQNSYTGQFLKSYLSNDH
ncbi:MAG: excinuclease ABC subunit UvrA [Acidobacteriota bacterium]|nr:excinuclease ABC subunit UvrA [Acidobacteriota bacterium]